MASAQKRAAVCAVARRCRCGFERRIVATAPRRRAESAFCASATGAGPRFDAARLNMNRHGPRALHRAVDREATKLRPGRRQPTQSDIRTMASCGPDEGRRDAFARARQRRSEMTINEMRAARGALPARSIAVTVLQGGSPRDAQEQRRGRIVDAMSKGAPILELRPRYEQVEQDRPAQRWRSCDAPHAPWLADAPNGTAFRRWSSSRMSASSGRRPTIPISTAKTTYAQIFDPETTELNRAAAGLVAGSGVHRHAGPPAHQSRRPALHRRLGLAAGRADLRCRPHRHALWQVRCELHLYRARQSRLCRGSGLGFRQPRVERRLCVRRTAQADRLCLCARL